MSKLEEGLLRLGLECPQSQISALRTYINCVLEFNKTYNIMKADSEDTLAINHVLDSLAAAEHLRALFKICAEEERSGSAGPHEAGPGTGPSSSGAASGEITVGDIGSGGGCPGIPLSVVFPEINFTLVERMEKRADFLERTIGAMGLGNVKVRCSAADSLPKESFNVAVFRAFHPFDKKITRLLLSLVKEGGFLAAYKARSEKIKEEMEAVSFLVPRYEKIPLTVPFLEDHERNLVVIKK